MQFEQDTIAAISTAIGQSGIGIIRISGKEAIPVAERVFRPAGGKVRLSEAASHTIHYGYIVEKAEKDQILDEVLVSVMRAPRTFTSEDTVEINCHGGAYAMRSVLEAVFRAGARPAQPGEFTKRAFLGGRIDLSQAEAVMDVISASNRYALQSSLGQLKGAVRDKISALRGEILYHTAKIESALDDPEHYSLEGYSASLMEEVIRWRRELRRMIDSADNGRLIREGISTVILGKPNAGKSSLMNRMLGQERAIVTDIAGTTRDIIHETMQIGGITLHLSDTAGIRHTEDIVEKIGVDKAMEMAEQSDLILFVIDSSVPLGEEDALIMQKIRDHKVVVLLNKSDLAEVTTEDMIRDRLRREDVPILRVSMKDGSGTEELEHTLEEMFYAGTIAYNDEVIITNERQKVLMQRADESLGQVEESIALGMPEDFFTIDLMDAYQRLGEIIGENISEDLANEIFDRFCMGK